MRNLSQSGSFRRTKLFASCLKTSGIECARDARRSFPGGKGRKGFSKQQGSRQTQFPTHLLSGTTTCGECGAAIAQVSGKSGGYYVRELSISWTEVLPTDSVRSQAERLLLRHPLRAADALQLAAAMLWVDAEPDGHPLITFDGRLAEAARGEGFRALP